VLGGEGEVTAVDPHPGEVLVNRGADFRVLPCLLQGLLREPLGGRQIGQLEVEEVTQRRIGEPGLRFRRAAGQHPMTSRPRDRNTGVPQSCLANPGRSLQEQGRGPLGH
jgi:hypothetical protein